MSRRPPPEWKGQPAAPGALFITSVTPTVTSGDNIIISRIVSGGCLYGWNWEKWKKLVSRINPEINPDLSREFPLS